IMGFNFNVAELGLDTYNATTAGGLTFWMKSDRPVTVQLLTPGTVLTDNGGHCADGANARNCNNHFAYTITAPADGWYEYKEPLSALGKPLLGSGTATWDPTKLLCVQFLVGQGVAFDVWVDDVAFYHC